MNADADRVEFFVLGADGGAPLEWFTHREGFLPFNLGKHLSERPRDSVAIPARVAVLQNLVGFLVCPIGGIRVEGNDALLIEPRP